MFADFGGSEQHRLYLVERVAMGIEVKSSKGQFAQAVETMAKFRALKPFADWPIGASPEIMRMPQKPETIDAYLATVSAERRAALEKLRKTILSILPDAEECISYSMPAFRHDGRVVAGFLATSKGCSYFPFSGTTLATLAADVKAYDRTKSALHFDPKHPLPVALVRKLLKARIAEIDRNGATKSARRETATRTASGRVSKRRTNRG